jgi:hypothetical protein
MVVTLPVLERMENNLLQWFVHAICYAWEVTDGGKEEKRKEEHPK